MAYSAIEKMRKKNEQIYSMDVGPMQPALSDGAATGFDLKSAALRFLHERCEGLFFDRQIEKEEERTGLYRGTSLAPDQIQCIAPLEYERWLREHQSMGWRNGDLYEQLPVPHDADEKSYRAAVREQTRCHNLVLEGNCLKSGSSRTIRNTCLNMKNKRTFSPSTIC